MRRTAPVYTATLAFVVAGLLWVGLSLLHTVMPTADVDADFQRRHPQFLVADAVMGKPSTFVSDGIPIVVWRRNEAQMAMAAVQDSQADWPMPFSQVTGKANVLPAHDANLTVDHEWLFVNAIDLGGLGCVVMAGAGDFGGFFDPCRGAHFDLAGRIRKGPSAKNLQVISAMLGPDGTYFELDLTHASRTNR